MSEDKAIEEAFEDYKEEVVDKGEQVEEEDEPQYSALELEAREDGHTTKDEWIAAGKDAERWKSAHEYVEYGKIKGALDKSKADQDKLREEYDKRFENLNKLHKTQTDAKIKALKADQRKAVEEADTEGFDEAQEKIDELKQEPEPVEIDKDRPKKDPIITEWEKKNDWINDSNDPRSADAIDFWNGYVRRNPNGTNADALKYVDKKMGLDKVPNNPRRDAPSETSRQAPAPKQTGKISMSDLTSEEKNLWANAGQDLWGGNQKEFLQSVKDSRR